MHRNIILLFLSITINNYNSGLTNFNQPKYDSENKFHFTCQNAVKSILKETVALAILNNKLYQYRMDNQLIIFQQQFDSSKNRLYFSGGNITINPMLYEKITHHWSSINNIHKLRKLLRITITYVQSLPKRQIELRKQTETMDYPIRIHFWLKNKANSQYKHGIFDHLTISKNLDKKMLDIKFAKPIVNIINVNLDGKCLTLFQYRKQILVTQVWLYIPQNIGLFCSSKINHIRLQRIDTNRLCNHSSITDQLLAKMEFAFSIKNRVYFFSFTFRQAFSIDQQLFGNFDQDFPIVYESPEIFFKCQNENPLIANYKIINREMNQMVYMNSTLWKKNDYKTSLLGILFALKYFAIILYFIIIYFIIEDEFNNLNKEYSIWSINRLY